MPQASQEFRAQFWFGVVGLSQAEYRQAVEGRIFSNAFADAATAIVRYPSADRCSRAGRCRLCARRFLDDRACGLTTLRFERVVQATAEGRLQNQIQRLRLKSLPLRIRSRPVRFHKSPKRERAVAPHRAR